MDTSFVENPQVQVVARIHEQMLDTIFVEDAEMQVVARMHE